MVYSKYHKDFEKGQELFDKVKFGGQLKLVSWDDDLQVDIKVEYWHGVRGLAVKLPSDKRFGKSYIQSETYIVDYLSQFKDIRHAKND